jgi:hypothetical protein
VTPQHDDDLLTPYEIGYDPQMTRFVRQLREDVDLLNDAASGTDLDVDDLKARIERLEAAVDRLRFVEKAE